jgi:cytochrome c556
MHSAALLANRMAFLVPMLLVLLAVSACSSNATPKAGANGIHDQRLHALMIGELDQQLTRLNVLAFDLHLTPAELDQQRQRRSTAIAASAAQLRNSASELLALQPTLPLQDADQERFAALAQQLQATALTLEQAAGSGRLQNLAPLMQELSITCTSCHSLYRNP